MSDGNRQNDANDGNGRNGYVNSALDVSTENVSEDEIRGSEAFMVVTQDNLKSGKTSIKKIGSFIKERASKIFKKKTILKRIPITNWLPKYNLTWAVGDLVAGITVGLTVIPQALAFASIVGLPPQYGLYGSFLGSFIYVIFGSSKDVPMGPTALICLLTYQATGDYGVEHAILLAFLAGAIELAMGLLGIGFIIDFISGPVASGFTSAVALIIFSSQIKDILGIAVRGNTFLQIWISIFENIGETTMWDPIMGCSCIIILLLMRKLAQVKIGPKASTSSMVGRESPSETVKVPKTWHNIVNKSLWLLSTARNALLVIVGGFIANALYEEGTPPPFKLIGHVPEGLPGVKLPPFGFENENVTYTFGEMVSNLGTSIAVVPLISMLENIALCKAFADGKPVDATQELIAIGLCNIGNSFLQAYPGTGALARGAVNNNSGVKTPFGGVYTGILVILSLLFFTPYFFYIPKATLAAVIIAAAVFTVEIKVIRPMWRSKKSDLIPGFVTFIACLLLPLEYGIIIGIALDILFILYHAARPKILIEKLVTRSGIEYLMLAPDRCLIFPSAEYVRKLVTKHSIKEGIPVTIDCSHIYGADFSTALVIESLSGDFAARYQPLVFYNLKPSVSAVFEGLSPKEFVVVYTQEQLDDFLDERCSSKSKANLATLSVGGSCVWSSPAIPRLNGKIDPANNPLGSNITSSQESWIASLYPLGASISAILSGFLTDKIGRKSTLLISSLPTIAGFGLLTFGASVHEFYFGRFFTGLGSGTVFTVIPIYIAEIAENDNRGRLGCLLIFFITIGNLMTYISAPHLTLKVLTGCNLAVPIIFLILFGIFVPESPYYYVGKKRYSKAEKSLLKLRRGRPEIVKTELVAIIKSVQESYANKVNFEEIRNDKALVRGFYICLGLVCFQQLSGINVIFFYMQSIFESSKIAISSDNCTIIVGTMQFLSSASTLSLVDKYGRRVLLLISAAGSAVSLLATGIYFYLLENSSRLVEGINWIPLVTINFFVVSYTLGFGPVAFAMIGEVFPPHIKSRAATICIFCSLMSTFCITNIFPYFKEWIGMGPSFCLLGIICCISGAFVYFKVPETKKKSLREVQELLRY